MNNTQVLPCIANRKRRAYSSHVAAKSAIRFGRRNTSRRNSAHTDAGAFFVPATFYGSCARDSFGGAGCLESRSTNLRTAATQTCLVASGGGSSTLGAPHMKYILALNPSKIRAAAHRRMAFAALHADSSLKTRLTRYQHHINQARALEAVGGAV